MNLGSFRVVRQLADGALGPTYLCTDQTTQRDVVVKALASSSLPQAALVERMRELANTHKKLSPGGIAKITSCVAHSDGGVLVVMPFVNGESVASIVARQPGVASPHAFSCALDVATLLQAGHEAGLRHLALRPSQVLLCRSSEPGNQLDTCLLGLGLAEALGGYPSRTDARRRTDYVAPERYDSAGVTSSDPRSDVFSVGVLLLHLLLGQMPSQDFIARSGQESEPLLPEVGLSSEIQTLLRAMLSTKLGERPLLKQVISALSSEIERASLSSTLMAAASASPNQAAPASIQPLPGSGSQQPSTTQISATPTLPAEAASQGRDQEGARAASKPLASEGALFGNFRVIRKLGEGGMGVVYEAEHTKIGRRAAIKVLHAEFAQNADYAKRFLNEARAVNIVRHPGLVEIFEYGQRPDGTLYIVMEYLQGESLHARSAKRNKPCSVESGIGWAVQIARALSAAHEKGIIHRDLKPGNVILVRDADSESGERAKIIDFGIARLMDTPQRRTRAGTVMGTPLYMAPEQCRGEDADERADVYAVGAILYEMLCGQAPFADEASVMVSKNMQDPRSLAELRPGLSPAIYQVVAGALQRDRANRPRMDAVVAKLRDLETELAKSESKSGAAQTLMAIGGPPGIQALSNHQRPGHLAPAAGKDPDAALSRNPNGARRLILTVVLIVSVGISVLLGWLILNT